MEASRESSEHRARLHLYCVLAMHLADGLWRWQTPAFRVLSSLPTNSIELPGECLDEQPEATTAKTDEALAVLQEAVRESGEHKAQLLSFPILTIHFMV
jgi:hypothetical protein